MGIFVCKYLHYLVCMGPRGLPASPRSSGLRAQRAGLPGWTCSADVQTPHVTGPETRLTITGLAIGGGTAQLFIRPRKGVLA